MLLNKTVLLAKLKQSDMIVLDAKYVSLKMTGESIQHWCWIYCRVAQNNDCEAQLHGIALTKLVAHMKDLQKEDFTSIQINRPHKVVQESA